MDANGHQKHVKDAGTQLTERARKGASAGKAMRVLAGPHAGLLCTVLEIHPKARTNGLHIVPVLSLAVSWCYVRMQGTSGPSKSVARAGQVAVASMASARLYIMLWLPK